jgi:DNA-binding transcriptional ArsR family regulator
LAVSEESRDSNQSPPVNNVLAGTTLRVYRYLYRSGEPQGVHDVQHGAKLSSPSVASYHLKKLLEMGLVKQKEDSQKYYVDRIIFENMIRFRRSLIPIQVGYMVFFASALAILVLLFHSPPAANGAYDFSALVIGIACAIFAYQAMESLKTSQSL